MTDRAHLVIKCLAAVLLFLLGKWLVHAVFDPRVESVAYSALRSMNATADDPEDRPIRIIDISEVDKFRTGSQPTPAAVLEDLVDQVSKLNPPPRAIGIDIDFTNRSFGDDGQIHRRDVITTMYADHMRFLKFVADRADLPGPKLFVGAGPIPRPLDKLFIPDHTDPELAKLAVRLAKCAALVVTESEDPSTMPTYYKAEGSEPLYSLGYQLANTIDPLNNRSLSLWQQFLSWLSPPEATEVKWKQKVMAVDYGIASRLEAITYRADVSDDPKTGLHASLQDRENIQISVGRFRSHFSAGYVVLIGYGLRQANDLLVLDYSGKVVVPARGEITPAIVQHAAFVDTYLNRPFVKASEPIGLALETIIALLFLVISHLHESTVHSLEHTGKARPGRLILTGAMFATGIFVLSEALFAGLGFSLAFTPVLTASLLLGIVASSALLYNTRESEPFVARTQVVRNALVSLAVAALAVGLTLLLAKAGVFWTGSLVVVVFVILKGHLEPVLEFVGLSFVQEFRKEPKEANEHA